VTAAFTPASVPNPGTSSSLAFTASATAATGTSTVTVTGSSGGVTRTTPIALTVAPAQQPDFALSAAPAAVTVQRGGPGVTSNIAIARLNGFTGTVALTAGPLPTGVSASFNPPSVANPGTGSVLTFTASATATLGTTTVTVTGTSGTLVRTAPITLTVAQVPNPDFTVGVGAPSVTVVRGGAAAGTTVTVTRLNGFTGTVALGATGAPTGVSAAFNPTSVVAPATTSALSFTASATAALGTTSVTVTGTNGALVRTTPISVIVVDAPQPNFSLAASPGSVTANRGGPAASSTITVTRLNGFTGAVALTAGSLPAGVSAVFTPTSIPSTGTTSTLAFTASATAALGTTTVTVTGASGVLTRTTSISLTVSGGGGTGGVTVTPVVNASGPWFNELGVRFNNTATLTALSVTVVIQRTTGVSFSGIYNTVGGQIAQSNSSTAAAITYQWTLGAGATVGAGTGRLFAAQAGGTGTPHPTSGDTWTLTYTTGGQTFTQSGMFP
jgi:hypothetical protein